MLLEMFLTALDLPYQCKPAFGVVRGFPDSCSVLVRFMLVLTVTHGMSVELADDYCHWKTVN